MRDTEFERKLARGVAELQEPGVSIAPAIPTKTGKDCPLTCEIRDQELVIRVGIDVLAFAEQGREPFTVYSEVIGDWRKVWNIVDPMEFANDVRRELLNESEDGSSMLTNLLDAASEAALDQGTLGVEESTSQRGLKTVDHRAVAE